MSAAPLEVLSIKQQVTDRVMVVVIAGARGAHSTQYAVVVDGRVVLRLGSATKWDFCEASSFAAGVAFGLGAQP